MIHCQISGKNQVKNRTAFLAISHYGRTENTTKSALQDHQSELMPERVRPNLPERPNPGRNTQLTGNLEIPT